MAEQAQCLPHHVRMASPPDGLGHRLNDMLDWCAANAPAEARFNYGSSFYFAEGGTAVAFRAAHADSVVRVGGLKVSA